MRHIQNTNNYLLIHCTGFHIKPLARQRQQLGKEQKIKNLKEKKNYIHERYTLKNKIKKQYKIDTEYKIHIG